ncbi:MAG TPA: hypothetical protein VEU31_04345 [Candidatus Acidoferrales bacterium]|nr:hypothetical protein [Candidatus Acidoferrales bacterium]
MRKLSILILILAVSAGLGAVSAGQQGRPIPPGIREADKASNAPLDPPLEMKRKPPELAQLRQEAAELARLAQGVPQQIDHAAQGQLPKDLSGNLKQIEKLAKRLRSELAL